MQYTSYQWLLIFYTYCFLGWCFESTYVSIKFKKVVNRGFLRGPFLPLYGSGATMMLVVSMPFQDNIILTYFAGVVGATALEYVTGVAMDTLFNVRYWDYSYKKFNFQGHICLTSSLAWGGFTILMTRVIHKPIATFILAIPQKPLGYIVFIITAIMGADFALSFKAAMDLRMVLEKMDRAKEELLRMQKRLDVMIAFAGDGVSQKTQGGVMKMGELLLTLEQKFVSAKNMITAKPSEYSEAVKEELLELRTKFNVYMEKHRSYREVMDFIERDMIRNNPTMISTEHSDTFEELRKMADTKKE